MEGVLAVITPFAANFAPKYWAFCQGQVLAISTNQALFSLMGTTYGGNGQTTFALPNLSGRMPIGIGQGAGLPNYSLGEVGGSTSVTLTSTNLPPHVHNGPINATIQADGQPGSETAPDGFYIAGFTGAFAATPVSGITLAQPNYSAVISTAGGNQPLSILSPMLCINHIICLQGLFPSRN